MTPDQLTEIFRHYKPPFRYNHIAGELQDSNNRYIAFIKGYDNEQKLFGQWVADTLNEKWEQIKDELK